MVVLFFVFCFFFFLVAHGPLTVVASPAVEHRLRTLRLSGHGSRAQPLRGMWDLPGPGHKPVSPASAGGLSTTAPPGNFLHSKVSFYMQLFFFFPLQYAGLSLLWPLPLWSTGSGRTGSAAMAHRPSCSAACGIFPDRGTNPCPLHQQADSQPLRHQGSPEPVSYTHLTLPTKA